jgi:hypothetical protein
MAYLELASGAATKLREWRSSWSSNSSGWTREAARGRAVGMDERGTVVQIWTMGTRMWRSSKLDVHIDQPLGHFFCLRPSTDALVVVVTAVEITSDTEPENGKIPSCAGTRLFLAIAQNSPPKKHPSMQC